MINFIINVKKNVFVFNMHNSSFIIPLYFIEISKLIILKMIFKALDKLFISNIIVGFSITILVLGNNPLRSFQNSQNQQ